MGNVGKPLRHLQVWPVCLVCRDSWEFFVFHLKVVDIVISFTQPDGP